MNIKEIVAAFCEWSKGHHKSFSHPPYLNDRWEDWKLEAPLIVSTYLDHIDNSLKTLKEVSEHLGISETSGSAHYINAINGLKDKDCFNIKQNKKMEPLTEREYIRKAILSAQKLEANDTNQQYIVSLCNELYDNLFAFRDSKKPSPLDAPNNYHLIDIFKELKSGRPAASQRFLDDCINQLIKLDEK